MYVSPASLVRTVRHLTNVVWFYKRSCINIVHFVTHTLTFHLLWMDDGKSGNMDKKQNLKKKESPTENRHKQPNPHTHWELSWILIRDFNSSKRLMHLQTNPLTVRTGKRAQGRAYLSIPPPPQKSAVHNAGLPTSRLMFVPAPVARMTFSVASFFHSTFHMF